MSHNTCPKGGRFLLFQFFIVGRANIEITYIRHRMKEDAGDEKTQCTIRAATALS